MLLKDASYEHKEPVLPILPASKQRLFDDLARTMHSTPPRHTTIGSNEELIATQARLYRMLVEATDRIERERGLPRTRAAEVARLNGLANGSESSDENFDNKDRKGVA
jgi:hypothetical protein